MIDQDAPHIARPDGHSSSPITDPCSAQEAAGDDVGDDPEDRLESVQGAPESVERTIGESIPERCRRAGEAPLDAVPDNLDPPSATVMKSRQALRETVEDGPPDETARLNPAGLTKEGAEGSMPLLAPFPLASPTVRAIGLSWSTPPYGVRPGIVPLR